MSAVTLQTEAVESKEDAYPVQVDYHGTPLVHQADDSWMLAD